MYLSLSLSLTNFTAIRLASGWLCNCEPSPRNHKVSNACVSNEYASYVMYIHYVISTRHVVH